MTKTVAIIDGNSLMHRAFHALPPTMSAPDGTPTNAVFGFLSMLLKFYETQTPDAIVCAFDAGKPKFRLEALAQYKAQRPPMDEALRAQFPVIEELLESLGIPVVKLAGWEGDDILGTASRMCAEAGMEALLITGDKDAYQLVNDSVRVVTTKKGITDVEVYGPAEVIGRYGVTPEQFPDFLGLQGDTADNIPGVAGVGPKKAATLLATYGSIEGIYEHLDQLKGKLLENLIAGKENAYISRDVARIVTDVPMDLDLESLSFPAFDPQAVSETFTKYRLMALLGKFQSLQDVSAGASLAFSADDCPALEGQDAVDALEDVLSQDGHTLGLAFGKASQESLFSDDSSLVAFDGSRYLVFEQDASLALAQIMKRGSSCALEAKSLLSQVYPCSKSQECLISLHELLDVDCFDLQLAAYLLNSNAGAASLSQLVQDYLQVTYDEQETGTDALKNQACAVYSLAPVMAELLVKDGSWDVFSQIDSPLTGVLVAMERVGARLDVDRLSRMAQSTEETLEGIRVQAYQMAGKEFNLDSPKQLSEILYDVLGLPAGKKTKTGRSTDAKNLERLKDLHPLPGEVLRYREIAKIRSTYVVALPRMREADGLVHTSFNQTVTTTGRLSSSNPNLQNIPVRTDFGRQIRECFLPLDSNSVFVSADYSQIELRLLAHLSGDDHLIQAFLEGEDFHAQTAARVFGIPVSQVTPQLRSRAKAVNFGIVYGQQAFGLSESLGISYSEAQDMINRYFDAYPGVRTFLDSTVDQAKRDGYAQTMFGRKRHIPELSSSSVQQRNFGERTAMNHPMQGSAADIIKIAMNRVQRRLYAEGLRAEVMIQVHDELDLSVPTEELETVCALLKEEMSSAVQLKVPLLVDVRWGENWSQAH